MGLQLAEAMTIDTVSYSTLVTVNSQIGLLLDSISILDSLNILNPDTANDLLRAQYTQQITILRNVAISILAAHSINAGLILDSMLLINAAVQPTELPDINRHTVYEILGEYYERGDSAIYNHYSTILSIAHQCPYEGGPIVYVARGLLRVVNDSIEYFDDVVCLQAGYYKLTEPNMKKYEHKITLVPNPTNNSVEVYSSIINEEQESIEIFNSIGELMYINNTEIGVLIKRIDLSSFKPGIYTVRVYQNEAYHLAKLVIIK